jgi:hypothetical protein
MVRRRVGFGSAVLHQEDHHMHIASIGIDLGKTTFHLVALGEHNKILLRKKFSRTQLLAYTANLPASLIGLRHVREHTSWEPHSENKGTRCDSSRRSL